MQTQGWFACACTSAAPWRWFAASPSDKAGAGQPPAPPLFLSENPAMSDVYKIVTERIAEALEAGVIPWRKPWVAMGLPRNLVTRREYRGMNVLLLSLGQTYASPYWLTFKQAKDLGGRVRRGEKASIVTFWKFPEAKDEKDERTARR